MASIKTVKSLLEKFVRLERELKNLGISTKNIVGGYGEFLAGKKLGLKGEKKSNNKGFDALDSKKRKYEIKTARTKEDDKYVNIFTGFKNKMKKFDYLVCISLDRDFNINLMFKVPYITFIKYYNKKLYRLAFTEELENDKNLDLIEDRRQDTKTQ